VWALGVTVIQLLRLVCTVQCDRDTQSHPVMTSSPVRQTQGSDQSLVGLKMCLVTDGNSGDSCQEPITVQPCRWTSQDKEPPDMSETISHSLYRNVISALFGINADQAQVGQLEDI
jgi:hypothetical protein